MRKASAAPSRQANAQPRPRDAEATRAQILKAAQSRFQHQGFEQTTLRDIADDAAVDVALVHRYFGGKAELFKEALKRAIQDAPPATWDKRNFAARFAARMADADFTAPSETDGFQFLLRAATSATTAPLLQAALEDKFLRPIRDWLGGRDVHARARLLTAITIGFLAEGLIRGEPLRGKERAGFIRRATSLVDSVLAP